MFSRGVISGGGGISPLGHLRDSPDRPPPPGNKHRVLVSRIGVRVRVRVRWWLSPGGFWWVIVRGESLSVIRSIIASV